MFVAVEGRGEREVVLNIGTMKEMEADARANTTLVIRMAHQEDIDKLMEYTHEDLTAMRHYRGLREVWLQHGKDGDYHTVNTEPLWTFNWKENGESIQEKVPHEFGLAKFRSAEQWVTEVPNRQVYVEVPGYGHRWLGVTPNYVV